MVREVGRRSRRSDAARVRSVGATAWQNYLHRAQQTLRAMQRSAADGDWAAVAAIGPACAIAAADAVVARVAGVVARDTDHAMAVELLLAHDVENTTPALSLSNTTSLVCWPSGRNGTTTAPALKQ